MPTNPSARRRRPSPSLLAPEPELKGTIEIDADKAASVAKDKQTMDDTRNDGIEGQATTARTATNTPATDTAGDRSIRTVIAILVLIGLGLAMCVLPSSGLLLPLQATLVLALSPLYPILSLLGVLYLTFRLVYAVCQDLLAPLKTLYTVLRLFMAVWMRILVLVSFCFYIFLKSLVLVIFGIILGMSEPDQRLETFLMAFYQSLLRRILGLSHTFTRSSIRSRNY